MKAGNLEAIMVVQDVRTGSLLALAASDPVKLDVTTPLLPLSPVKLMVAASWWDHEESAHLLLSNSEQLLTDSIVSGNDAAGRRLASALRESIGNEAVLKDLERYGFPFLSAVIPRAKDTKFWAEIAPSWRDRLTPTMSYHSLGTKSTTKDWEDALSIGETNFIVTALHVSRFLQAVGNAGVMLPPVARSQAEIASKKPDFSSISIRIMQPSAALKLAAVMRGAVERGTAKTAAPILADTAWSMGGKTGTGPDLNAPAPGPTSDGWFAGLIFDPKRDARFTVVTFVRHGGFGGGNAARISAELARFLAGADPANPGTEPQRR